jgi:LysM repeat protein
MWIKSACVLLAWSIVLIITAAGVKEPARPAQANTRNANSTLAITVTSTRTADAPLVAAHAAPRSARYLVQPGDTLSGIAARFGLPGGWRRLYAANRTVIGSDPNVIRTGTVLALPGPAVPARYQIAAGDTLSGIAARFGLPGGWRALYAANRAVVGPDPNLLRTGTVLAMPGRAPSPPAAHPGHHLHQPPRPPAHPGRHAHQSPRPTAHPGHRTPESTPPAGSGHTRTAVPTRTPRSTASPVTAMPAWLDVLLVAVGVLIAGAFLLHLIMAVARRQQKAAARAAAPAATATVAAGTPGPEAAGGTAGTPSASGTPGREATAVRPAADRAAIVMADHDRLIVTHSEADGTIYVLRPPGADPAAILQVARLVLAESGYRDLAEHLGLPASWPIFLADYHRLVVTHSAPDNTVCVLRPPGEDPMAVLRAARLVLQEEPYEELASQLGVPASWPLE